MNTQENYVYRDDKGENQTSINTKISNLFISKESFDKIKAI